jgi:hypothetical protein
MVRTRTHRAGDAAVAPETRLAPGILGIARGGVSGLGDTDGRPGEQKGTHETDSDPVALEHEK